MTPTKFNLNKFWVASIAPVVAAVWPFVSDGFQSADVGPIVVAVLVALGVYAVPNKSVAAPSRGFVGD